MIRNVDAAAMRRINRAAVLNHIRKKQTTSRVEIADYTGLNKATVSSLVEELIAERFVVEIGLGSSKGGRKPILLEFNVDAAYSVGIDIQITHMTTVLCNIEGVILYKSVTKIPAQEGQPPRSRELLEDLIRHQVHTAIASAPVSPHGVVGVGVALPGMVNHLTGRVYHLPNLHIGEWDVRAALEQHFLIPVMVDNDANCGAWSEFQKHRAAEIDLVFINAGIGIGAGLVLDGRLHRGKDGLAGEFGHTTIVTDGRMCQCGNTGCWEQYGSEQSLVRYIREAGGEVPSLSGEDTLVDLVVFDAHLGNAAYIRALSQLGRYLGIGIVNIANALNPGRISLGGTLSRAAPFIRPEIERVLKERSISHTNPPAVTVANLRSVAVGAAGMALEEALFPISGDLPAMGRRPG